jgi:serine/threonine-protein kinase
VQNEQNDEAPVGTVIRVDPAPGTEVPANQPITLVLSAGREQVTVPPVEGLNEQNARNQLEAAGLSVTVSQQDVSRPEQDGRVLSQSPAANQRVNRGDTVNIVVGRLQAAGPGN